MFSNAKRHVFLDAAHTGPGAVCGPCYSCSQSWGNIQLVKGSFPALIVFGIIQVSNLMDSIERPKNIKDRDHGDSVRKFVDWTA